MIIGFDLDGVLCNIDVVSLHLMNKLPPDEEALAEIYYYTERKPLLDPQMMMMAGDVYHIITSRHDGLYAVTMDWCERYCPGAESINVVGGKPWYRITDDDKWSSWSMTALKRKAEKINELGCEVYLDDSVKNVRVLRGLCPDVTILQYGGRLR